MDLLQAEISRKRKLAEQVEISGVETKTKALRQEAIQSLEQEILEKQVEKKSIVDNENLVASTDATCYGGVNKTELPVESERQKCWVEVSVLSEREVESRLRDQGEAITLFGEDDGGKRERLDVVMMKAKEWGAGDAKKISSEKNGTKSAEKAATKVIKKDEEEKKVAQENDDDGKEEEADVGVCTHYSDDLERMGPEKVIYKYFKNLVHQWEMDLSRREVGEINSAKGRADSNSLNHAKESVKSLFKLCKKKEIPPDIRNQLMDMVKSCEAGNFRQAHDHYLQAAIGKAAWPIGVTSVGIHQRSNRERLSESKIAHVMNNEMQRKYFTAVKRLMTYAQSKRPDILPSMKVL